MTNERYRIRRTAKEINSLLFGLRRAIEHNRQRFPDTSYEVGAESVLWWLFGKTNDDPYPDPDF